MYPKQSVAFSKLDVTFRRKSIDFLQEQQH
jgi:hypothetical protein